MDRVSHGWDDNPYADEEGAYVLFTEAQAEIDSRDKRIAELEADLRKSKMMVGVHMQEAFESERVARGLASAIAGATVQKVSK